MLTTPTSDAIPLHVTNGLWHITMRPPTTRTTVPPDVATHNRFSALTTEDNATEEGTPSPPSDQEGAATPAPATKTQDVSHPAATTPSVTFSAPSPNEDDLVTRLHETHNHCDLVRLLRIAKNLQQDPTYMGPVPSATGIKRWYSNGGRCAACRIMASKASLNTTHPSRRTTTRGYNVGEMLHIDSIGGLADNDKLSVDGSADAYCITDDTSAARWCIPVPSKSPDHLANILSEFQAQSGIPIRRILADNPLIKGKVKKWCNAQQPPVAYGASPPRHQVSNARSEACVNYIKTKSRVLRQRAGASEYLHIEACRWAALASNFVPSSADASHAPTVPAHVWPDMPWLHRNLRHDVPWGCRAYVHYGKTTTDPDWLRRARPCVFVGWSTFSPSYRLYDLDARDIVEAAETQVTSQVDNFPMLNHKLHGETLPGDLALNIDG